jgi:2-hydroxycyclohexanecarboxyl-CoA dehydrogenase
MAMQKVALVTGGAAGIGRACCVRLAEEGYAIGVLDLDERRCAGTVDAVQGAGGKVVALGADIADRAQVRPALAKLRAALGPVTILVNNAGVAEFLPFEEITDERWDRMFAINVRGTFIVTQEVLPDMKAAKWGRIVNISSSSAQTGTRVQVHYSASKGAIVSLTRSLAEALGPHGITVNNIPPGSVMHTIMSEENRERFPVPIETLTANMPVRRLGEPEDIANACAWLCDERSSYVTGQTIGVNGGRVVS